MKKISILGGGESGVGAALLAKAKGLEVFLSDKSLLDAKYKALLESHQITFEEGKHTEQRILAADEVVKSPGIPDHIPLIQQIIQQQIPIISEIEFAARYTKAPLIAITGTNGKTTTTLLIHHLLKTAGFSVGIAGNIGESFAKQVINDPYDNWVLEVSSFQLDHCYQFKPYIALLLNITPDHLDRYDYQMEQYAKAKWRITQQQTATDYLLYNAEDARIKAVLHAQPTQAKDLPIATTPIATDKLAAFLQEEHLQVSEAGKLLAEIPTAAITLQGKHNLFNSLCALAVGYLLRVPTTTIKTALATFQGAPHRLQKVAELADISFVNDSKATNVEAVYYALEYYAQQATPLIWIVGGVDKGNDYKVLEPYVFKNVKKIIALGKENEKVKRHFGTKIPVWETQDMIQAVQKAYTWAEAGETVLLSPACASFDLFKNYEDRGNQFITAVQQLTAKKK